MPALPGNIAEPTHIDAAGMKLVAALRHSLSTHAGGLSIINATGPVPALRPGSGLPPRLLQAARRLRSRSVTVRVVGTSDDQERAPDFAALAELAEGFNALVQALQDGDRVVLTPARIVEVAASCMPRSQHATLTVIDHGHARNIATTSDVPMLVDHIRQDTGQGPTLDVLETNDLVMSGDLIDDPRWPQFGARVTEATSIRSIVSYRLHLSPDHRAALTFYSDWPHAFDDLAIATGAIFAAYGSLTLTNELVLSEPVTPRRSADVHREIGVAIGILMTTAELTTQSAYQQLHHASQQLHRSLPNLARDIIVHGGMPDGVTP